MNYIGSKDRLIQPLIVKAMQALDIPFEGRFGDAFAGTHAVGRAMQELGFSVFANDLQAYSAYIGSGRLNTETLTFDGLADELALADDSPLDRPQAVFKCLGERLERLDELYDVARHGDWFMGKYGDGGTGRRRYFTRDNARRIQYLRSTIDEWSHSGLLTPAERHCLIYSALMAADKVANTASVYYAFLKGIKETAKASLRLARPPVARGPAATVTCQPAEEFVATTPLDVLYLDPPYNERQYAPNYHILETIARWDDPEARGVGGVRPYDDLKSAWCYKKSALGALDDLLGRAEATWVLLSYSDEGLMTGREIEAALKARGELTVFQVQYPRFKSSTGAKKRMVTEYLYALKRR